MYNLINTVQSPTGITKSTKSLLYVIILSTKNHTEPAIVMDLGFLDQLAQVFLIKVENLSSKPQELGADSLK